MKKTIKRVVLFLIVLTIMSMFTTSLLSNASYDTIQPVSSKATSSSTQTLQASDLNSEFSAGWNVTQGYMHIHNQLSTSNYVILSITAFSASGLNLGVISYSGILGNGMYHYLANNNSNAASFQVSVKMYNGTTPSESLISDWSANIGITNSSITIQGNDGNSIATISKNNSAVVLSLNNLTGNTNFTSLNIAEYSSMGTVINTTSLNSNLQPNNSYIITRPNTTNTFQLSAQMWNNTAPTGTVLSYWTATA